HLSLIRATYKDFLSQDPVFPFGPDGIQGSGDELYDLSGHTLIQTPRASGHLGATYSLPMAKGASLQFGVHIYAQSRMFLRAFNLDPYDKQGSYTKTNIGARFSSNDRWFLYG